jgi:hypothetical protein
MCVGGSLSLRHHASDPTPHSSPSLSPSTFSSPSPSPSPAASAGRQTAAVLSHLTSFFFRPHEKCVTRASRSSDQAASRSTPGSSGSGTRQKVLSMRDASSAARARSCLSALGRSQAALTSPHPPRLCPASLVPASIATDGSRCQTPFQAMRCPRESYR